MQLRQGMERPKKRNPTKEWLNGYYHAKKRRDSLLREIEADYLSAMRATSRIKAVAISGTSQKDGIAESVVRIADAKEQLRQYVAKIDLELARIERAIESVSDERYKTLLTMRYIEGMSWRETALKMGYSEENVFKMHGYALIEVERYRKRNERE